MASPLIYACMRVTETWLEFALDSINAFPQVPPKFHMMSSVTHPSLDPVTIEYKGPAVRGWNPMQSSLAAVVKAIHDEF